MGKKHELEPTARAGARTTAGETLTGSAVKKKEHSLLPPPIFFSFFLNFYWSIVDLQHCVSFRCTAK